MNLATTEAARLLSSRRRAIVAEGEERTWNPIAPEYSGPETQREIVEIDAALARIADGTYGTCETCGGAIGRDRLRALPEVRRCQQCSG